MWSTSPRRPDAALAVSLSPRTNQTYLHVRRACYLHGCESLSVLFRLTRRSAAAQTPVTSARRPEEICAAAARHAGMRWPFPRIIINTCRALGKVNEWEEGVLSECKQGPQSLVSTDAAVCGNSHQTDETLSYSFTKLSNNTLSVCVFLTIAHINQWKTAEIGPASFSDFEELSLCGLLMGYFTQKPTILSFVWDIWPIIK